MEQNNLTNKKEEKGELEKPIENTGEHKSDNQEVISNLERPESEVSVIDGAENALKVKAELETIAKKTEAEIKKYNQTREEMGLPKVDLNENNIGDHIPSLKSRFKKWGGNLMKAVTFAGLMFSANEGLSQNSNAINGSKEKIEAKVDHENLLNRFKKYDVVPQSMTLEEFNTIFKNKELMKELSKKYSDASGVILSDSKEAIELNKKNLEVISKTVFHIDESQEEKFQTREYTDADRKKDIETIWEKVKKGNLKYGDTVVLRNGETYVIKDYKPGYKKATGNVKSEVADTIKNTQNYVAGEYAKKYQE